jgi:hypothetical protein
MPTRSEPLHGLSIGTQQEVSLFIFGGFHTLSRCLWLSRSLVHAGDGVDAGLFPCLAEEFREEVEETHFSSMFVHFVMRHWLVFTVVWASQSAAAHQVQQ